VDFLNKGFFFSLIIQLNNSISNELRIDCLMINITKDRLAKVNDASLPVLMVKIINFVYFTK
jgi:hypothetical protein